MISDDPRDLATDSPSGLALPPLDPRGVALVLLGLALAVGLITVPLAALVVSAVLRGGDEKPTFDAHFEEVH